jgi:hypothetical protein
MGRSVAGAEPDTLTVIILLCHSLVFAIIWAGLWLSLLVSFPQPTVWVSLIGFLVVLVAQAGYNLVLGKYFEAAVGVLVASLYAGFLWFSRDRIPPTASLIKEFIGVLKSYPWIFGVVFGMLACMVGWLLVWILAFAAMIHWGAGGLGMIFVLFLSFYWGCQVFSNVCHVTTAGLAGRWYFSTQLEAPVGTAFKHAWTYQFGSICLGSLLVAIIQALRKIVRIMQDQARDSDNEAGQILGCVADCILGCFENVMRMFNTFTFTIVAIYYVPFCRAGKEVIALVMSSACEEIFDYYLVTLVTFMGSLAAAILNAIITAALAWRVGLEGPWVWVSGGLGFFMGYAVASVIGRLLDSGTVSLITCWAMEPKTLEGRNSELSRLFEELRGFAAEKNGGALH